jgi:predicted phage-related endonuclease
MGMSKYRSPNDELLFSIDAINGKIPDDISNEAMQWGNELEPVILRKAAERLQLTDLQTEHTTAYFHPVLPLSCSLDGYADGRGQVIKTDASAGIFVVGQESITLEGYGVLEAKLTAMDPEDVLPLWRGPIQLQAQMDIMDCRWGAIATLYKGTELRIFLFAPHRATIDRIAEVTQDFDRRLTRWKEEQTLEEYPFASSKDADRTWSRTAPDEEAVVLDSSLENYAATILQAKQEIENLQAQIEGAEIAIKTALQSRPAGIAGRYQIKWPMRHYKAQPEKVVPAKEAYSIRQSTLSIKEISA